MRVAPVAPRPAIASSSPGGNSTEMVAGSDVRSVVTVGSKFANASMTPNGLVTSWLKSCVMSDELALLTMASRLAVVLVTRSDHASTSWTGRTWTLGGGTVSGVTAIMLAPTRAIPAVA